ncbi:MAG: SCO family protein [Thermomicrobiales bacterium]
MPEIVMEPPKTLPDLTLQHTDGLAWTSSDMHGRLSLFFFGYTNCPDVCPLTLSRARQIYDALGADAEAVDVYFTTVDPERDTPERLGRYVEQFNPAFLSLTGSTEQLEAAKNAFGVVAVRQETGSSSGYSVDHTATSYLIDGTGSIRAVFPHDAATEDVLHDIRVLLDETDS